MATGNMFQSFRFRGARRGSPRPAPGRRAWRSACARPAGRCPRAAARAAGWESNASSRHLRQSGAMERGRKVGGSMAVCTPSVPVYTDLRGSFDLPPSHPLGFWHEVQGAAGRRVVRGVRGRAHHLPHGLEQRQRLRLRIPSLFPGDCAT